MTYEELMLMSKLLKQQDPYVEQDPAYLDAAAEYATIPEQQRMEEFLLKQGVEGQNTEMPKGHVVRNGIYVAPSILGVAGSAAKQAMGGIQQRDALAAISELLGKKQRANRMGLEADDRLMRARAGMQKPTLNPYGGLPPGWTPPKDPEVI